MGAAEDLAAAVLRRIADDAGTAGTVTGTVSVTSPLTVSVRGNDLQLGRLAAYTPAVGDTVLVLTSRAGRWVVLGKVVGA